MGNEIIKYDLTSVRLMDTIELKKILLLQIKYAHQYTGYAPSIPFDFQVSTLFSDLTNDYPLTNEHIIKMAFKKGLHGEFGEFMGLSNKTYISWVRTALKEFRLNNPGLQIKQNMPVKPEPTEKEKRIIYLNSLNFCIDLYKRTGEISDIGNSLYDTLLRDKAIQKLHTEFMDDAQKFEYNTLETQRNNAVKNFNKTEVNRIDTFIQDAMNINSHTILVRAKRMALAYWIENRNI